MVEKERKINPRSLENLKLGAIARNQGKLRRNTTLLPETIEWLEARGNVSEAIDTLVSAAKKDELKSEYAHEQIQVEQQVSNNVHKQTEALKAEVEQLNALHSKQESEINSLYEKNRALQAENEHLRLQVENLEGENNFQQNRWELTERHNNGLLKEFQALEEQLQELKLERDQLDHEVNELHQKNGDLNLEVEILKQQLKDAANSVNEFELKEAKASAEYWEATAKDIGTQADKLANKLLLSKEIENPTQKTDIKAVNSLQPLSQRQLGKRLGVSHTAIGKKQKLTIFTDWTRERDPEGLAWEYDEQSKLFQPLKLQ